MTTETTPAALRLDAGLGAWLPIDEAPDGALVVVGWRDEDDQENPDRHEFDYKEDGVWVHYAERVEHYEMVAPPGCRGPKQTAPYTHYMELAAVPKAPNGPVEPDPTARGER